jgi:hypothetical protein
VRLDFHTKRDTTSSDALSDFVKLGVWVFDQVPGSESEFWSGYGSNPLVTKEARMRYHLSLGLELLSGLLYWQKTGQSAMRADYEGRFRHWLAQS